VEKCFTERNQWFEAVLPSALQDVAEGQVGDLVSRERRGRRPYSGSPGWLQRQIESSPGGQKRRAEGGRN